MMMGRFEEAVRADVEERIVDAAEAYEDVIKDLAAAVDAFINLAFLYWNSTDIGVSGGYRLSREFVRRAGVRYEEVLTMAKARFGDLIELCFWEKYFAYAGIGDPPFVEECMEWLKAADVPDVVYLHVYTQTDDPQYLPFVGRLLSEAQRLPTTKNRYIMSVLESGLSRLGHVVPGGLPAARGKP